MRFVSWNVNGLRACMNKGFMDFFNTMNADFFCLQETKLQEGQIHLDLPGYEQYWNYAEKKGYSGTAIFTKHTPLSVAYGMGIPELDTEGRLITLEYPEFYLVTCYTPNAQRELARIDHRLKWEAAFREYLTALDSKKPVILCGDLNVAHKEIDLKNPNSNRGSAGFSDAERDAFSQLLESGFTDSFRHLHPDTTGAYTWWSYMFNARQNNAGWRIDYFVVSERIKEQIYATPIYSDVLGSDHCPVGLDIDITCNGSVWPSFENTEITSKTDEIPETKSSGVKAAAALLCAAVLLTGIFLFLPRNTPEPLPETTPTTETNTTAPVFMDSISDLRWFTYGEEPDYMFTASSSISSFSEITGFFEGEKLYTTDKIKLPENINFWIRVVPMDYEKAEGCELTATVADTVSAAYGHTETPAYWNVAKYRNEDGLFSGWFVFGYIQRDSEVSLKLSNANAFLKTDSIHVSPIYDADDAKAMTTDALVDYAVHLRLTDELVKSQSKNANFISMLQYYPALLELTFRSDARYCLRMHGENYPSCSTNANLLVDILDSVLTKFDLYRDHYYNDAIAYPTQELIGNIKRHTELKAFISEYKTLLGNDRAVYQILRYLKPGVAQLENQTDAAQLLLKNYGQSPVIDFLIMQPEFLSKLSFADASELIQKMENNTGGLTTEDLVHVITCIRDVRLSLKYSVPYTYESLRLQFPAMQVLEQSEGVTSILLGYSYYANHITDEQKAAAKALLKTDYYYSKLTEYEKQELTYGPILYGDTSITPILPWD